jgi:hypothetical protein
MTHRNHTDRQICMEVLRHLACMVRHQWLVFVEAGRAAATLLRIR